MVVYYRMEVHDNNRDERLSEFHPFFFSKLRAWALCFVISDKKPKNAFSLLKLVNNFNFNILFSLFSTKSMLYFLNKYVIL